MKHKRNKRSAWFKPTRGSYLPVTWQGWVLYVPLVLAAVLIISDTLQDGGSLTRRIVRAGLEFVCLGALFQLAGRLKS